MIYFLVLENTKHRGCRAVIVCCERRRLMWLATQDRRACMHANKAHAISELCRVQSQERKVVASLV